MLLAVAQKEDLSGWEALVRSLGSFDFWFQVVVLVVFAPIWFPILRAIYREIDRSLRAEGGVFARAYTQRELEAMHKEEGARDLPLQSVPRVDPRDRARRGAERPAAKRTGPTEPRSGGVTGRSLTTRRGRGF